MPVVKATTSYREGREAARRADARALEVIDDVAYQLRAGNCAAALESARELPLVADDLIAAVEMMGAALK